ncbi:hypothetical protein L484_007933 [Morus notabilis]|uniref:Uncharacterized protein n=1 Tax=Morus notabilis TaxID=981085 RepID=W9RW35_9ROSA|nr:hypothetical protein L484_007933 [Morus notabilis]
MAGGSLSRQRCGIKGAAVGPLGCAGQLLPRPAGHDMRTSGCQWGRRVATSLQPPASDSQAQSLGYAGQLLPRPAGCTMRTGGLVAASGEEGS